MDEGQPDLQTRIIDLTDVTLLDLRTLDNSVLGNSLRRLVEETRDPRDVIASWTSSI